MGVLACGGGDEAAPAPERPSPTPIVGAPVITAPIPAPRVSPTATPTPTGVRVVDVTNHDPGGPTGGYNFEPNEFTFQRGETVELRVTGETEFHTFTVDDLGIDISLDAGATETLTFTFDKPGTFKLICIPHESLGMVGTITVQ